MKAKYECPDNTCEFKAIGSCPFPIAKGKNCVHYVEPPCVKCSVEKDLYPPFGNPESQIMVIGGCNFDSDRGIVASQFSRASSETNLPASYYYTTAVKCRVSKKPTITLIKKCNTYIKREIDIIKPRYVMLIGETAFKAVLWDFDLITRRKPEIDACAGAHIIKDGIVYLPVHNFKDIENDTAKRYAFREHIKKFLKLINGIIKITPTYYKEVDSEKDLIHVKNTAEQTGRVAIDIETNAFTSFLPDSEITTLSLTVNEAESFVIPLSYPHEAYFKKWNYTPKINTMLAIMYINKILKNPNITKIFHNAAFDIVWLETILGLDVINYDDTMLMKFLMNQNDQERKGLKPLLKQFTDIGFYEYALKQYVGEGESYMNIPPGVIIDYNAGDTDGTLRLWNLFQPMLRDKELWNIHYNFMVPRLRGIMDLVKTGIALDIPHCIRMKEKNEERLVELFSKLRSLKEVASFERQTGLEFKPGSDKHKFAVVYGGEVTTEVEVPRRIVNGRKQGKKEYQKVVYTDGFNLEAITVSAKNTKGKREQRKSFGKTAIQKYLKGIYKDVEYLDPINTFNLDPLPEDTSIMKFIKLSTEIGSIQTQLSNHIEPFINIWGNTVDKCVHTSYDITGTATGRLSCVAKGTMIEIVRDISKFPKGIPIERVKVGDIVYSYDDANNLCLRRVTWQGKTGYKKCVRVHWLGQGRHHKGYIDLTYDHKVRLVNGTWKEAGKLEKNDRILSMSRTKTCGYSRLHSYKNKEIRDHIFISKYFTYVPLKFHIHHKDFTKLNNEVSNLQVLSPAEHGRIHYNKLTNEAKNCRMRPILTYDRSILDYKAIGAKRRLKNRPSKFTLLRMLALCGGKLATTAKTYNYDFNTLKQYISSYNIEWREIRHRYGADGTFLSKRRIHKTITELKTIPKVAKELRIGTELAKFYISRNNHIITHLEHIGYEEVYNLEVTGTHRYIANELCVKNSRNPNLQNLKRDGFVKEAFISRWGDEGILIEADYKQLELFVMAIVSQDPTFIHAFTHGIDLHIKTAANIVFRCVEEAVSKQMRTMAKTVNFGMIYGKTAYSLKDDLNVTEEEAEAILADYFREYPGVYAYCERIKAEARSRGYVTTVMGRRRYLDYSDPNGADRQAVNTTIQSPASDVCVTAVNLLQQYYRKVATDRALKTKTSNINWFSEQEINKNTVALACGTVHDSIIIDCKRKFINPIVRATKLIMENTDLPWLTIPLKVDIKYGKNLRKMEEWDGESEIILDKAA